MYSFELCIRCQCEKYDAVGSGDPLLCRSCKEHPDYTRKDYLSMLDTLTTMHTLTHRVRGFTDEERRDFRRIRRILAELYDKTPIEN